MKWALVTVLLGYLVLWQIHIFESYIIGVGLVLFFGFSTRLYWKKIEVLPSFKDRTKAIFALLFLSLGITFTFYLLVELEFLDIIWYPFIFGTIVLSRHLLRFIINLTVKEPKSFGVISETNRGETVRSKAEKKVADWFYENQIDYIYEQKIELPNNETILSDFYLPESEIFVEYWGLSAADNQVGEKYRERKAIKIELYEKFDYKLISIYPHHLYELDHYIPDQIGKLTSKSKGFWNWIISLFKNSANTSINSEQKTKIKLYCTNCGFQVEKIGEYCVKCGTHVES